MNNKKYNQFKYNLKLIEEKYKKIGLTRFSILNKNKIRESLNSINSKQNKHHINNIEQHIHRTDNTQNVYFNYN